MWGWISFSKSSFGVSHFEITGVDKYSGLRISSTMGCVCLKKPPPVSKAKTGKHTGKCKQNKPYTEKNPNRRYQK